MILTNPNGLPGPYVRAVSQLRQPVPKRISVTELLTPPQIRYLMLAHGDEIEATVDSRIDLFFGTAVHEHLAKFAGSEALAEERLEWAAPDGWTIHGTPDHAEWLDMENVGVLTDWKTTRVRALAYDRPEWEAQVNLYAHLLRLNGRPVTSVQVKAFLRDYDPQKRWEEDYPKAPICHVDIPLWDAYKAHEFMLERLRLHQEAESGAYAPCNDEDRWLRTTYAVMSKRMEPKKADRLSATDSRRARRVFDSELEAVEYAEALVEYPRKMRDWYDIETRRGRATRCESYCAVSAICSQWGAEQAKADQQGNDPAGDPRSHLSLVRAVE